MSHVFYALGGKGMLNHDREVLQDHSPWYVGQPAFEERTLAANTTTHVDENGRLFIYERGVDAVAFYEGLKVERIQPGVSAAQCCHPQTEVSDEVGAVLVRPLERRSVRVVGDLEWRLDDIVWILEAGVFEELGSFDDGRGNYVISDVNFSDTSHQSSRKLLWSSSFDALTSDSSLRDSR